MLLKKVQLRNILSFGPDAKALTLGPLNVLIGPNGSGKSNLIEVVSLLQAASSDIMVPIRKGGGVQDWLWKGANGWPDAELEAIVTFSQSKKNLRYRLVFTESSQRFELVDERLENEFPEQGKKEEVAPENWTTV